MVGGAAYLQEQEGGEPHLHFWTLPVVFTKENPKKISKWNIPCQLPLVEDHMVRHFIIYTLPFLLNIEKSLWICLKCATACFLGYFHQNIVTKSSWWMDMIVTGTLTMTLMQLWPCFLKQVNLLSLFYVKLSIIKKLIYCDIKFIIYY